MGSISRTGLIASPTKKFTQKPDVVQIQLRAVSKKAPFLLKPFAGLYNPYHYGCSILCNHPTDNESKEVLKRVKETWGNEGKNLLLADEINVIRNNIEQIQQNERSMIKTDVPEELFRRYTETDSRPLTPAPTLISAATRASGSRRCVTPDPTFANQIREKTMLILDLRRSHSQETLSWHGSASLLEPPIIRIQRVQTRCGSIEDNQSSPNLKSVNHLLTQPPSRSPTPSSPKALKKKPKETIEVPEKPEEKDESDSDEEDDKFIKRRGKRRRKKRDGSRGPPVFQTSIDPETQVGTIGPESHNPSARPSLIPAASEDIAEVLKSKPPSTGTKTPVTSYLEEEILKQLRRELNEEVVDNEFNIKRRLALKEALKSISKDKVNCEELKQLQNELKIPRVNAEMWLSLPRVFTRSSARFELPLDSRTLESMSPLDYVRDHVSITSARKMLYNCIFNKFKVDVEDDVAERLILGKNLQSALNVMMGKPMTTKQEHYIRNLVQWDDEEVLDFRTFCGLSALCERLLAREYCFQLPDRISDPCHEIEIADFASLPRKLNGKKVRCHLVEILESIQNF